MPWLSTAEGAVGPLAAPGEKQRHMEITPRAVPRTGVTTSIAHRQAHARTGAEGSAVTRTVVEAAQGCHA